MTRPRIILADDHQMLADALRSVVEPQVEVVAIVNNGVALLEAVERLQPDIVVLDIGMPLLNGIDAGRKINNTWPKIKLIFMTMNNDPYLVGETFRAGGSAFLLKEAAVSELIDAINRVLHGGTYLTARATEGLEEIESRDPRFHETAPRLTPKQREVVRLLAGGLRMREAAITLGVTQRTVAEHKYAVMKMLGLKSDADLVRYAVEHGIVPLRKSD
jgi:DNA-binding NarL/FixJ family response regulator